MSKDEKVLCTTMGIVFIAWFYYYSSSYGYELALKQAITNSEIMYKGKLYSVTDTGKRYPMKESNRE